MSQQVRIFVTNLVVLFLIIAFFGGFFYFLARTAQGSWLLTKLVITAYVGTRQITFQSVTGSLLTQLTYKNVEIKEIPWLPQGAVIKLQQLDVGYDSWNRDGIKITLQNGRLFLSDTDVILFYGEYRGGDFNIHAYSKNVNVRGILSLFSKSPSLTNTLGTVQDFDVSVTGRLTQPSLNGKFYIVSLERGAFFLMKDCPGTVSLTLKHMRLRPELHGEVAIESGSISRPQSATIALKPSKILFKGDPKIPHGQVAGTAVVEGTRIMVALDGPLRRPQITLTSDPPRPENMLAVMLMTNRAWSATEASAQQGKLSPELAGDFVDFFVFGGPGKEISRQLGIRAISLYLDQTTRSVGVTKEVINAVDMGYQIQQTQESEFSPIETTQRISGSVKVHENVTLQAEQAITQDTVKAGVGEKPAKENTIWLKFKRGF